MLAQDKPVARLGALENLDRFFGEPKPRHQVRHKREPAAKDVGRFFFAVGLVDDAQDGAGVGVDRARLRQERVQHEFDRRIWRRRVDQVGAREGDQFGVGDCLARAQRAQRTKPHGGQPRQLNLGHVGAAGLHVKDFGLFAEHVVRFCLERGVAAAMQDELAVAAEKSCRVNQQRQVAADAGFSAARDQRVGVTLDPAALHGAMRSAAGKAARPPTPAARLLRTFFIADFGDDGFRGGRRRRCGWRVCGFRIARGRRRLAHR